MQGISMKLKLLKATIQTYSVYQSADVSAEKIPIDSQESFAIERDFFIIFFQLKMAQIDLKVNQRTFRLNVILKAKGPI